MSEWLVLEMKILTQTVSDDTTRVVVADVDLKIVFVVTDSSGTPEEAVSVHLQTVID